METLKEESIEQISLKNNNQLVTAGIAFSLAMCIAVSVTYTYTAMTKDEEEKHYYQDDNGDIWISRVAYDTYNAYDQLQKDGIYSVGNGKFADIKDLNFDDQIYVCEKYVIDQGVYRDLFFGKEEFPVFSCKIDGHNVNYIYEGKDANGIYNKKSVKIR